MRAVVGEAIAKARLKDGDRARIAIGFGLAGIEDPTDAARVVEAFPGYRLVRAANDAVTACIGAHAGADGGLVIAGTGSAAIARVRGKETIIGGRGFTIGDDGAGAHIGLDAVRAAMRAFDRLGPASALTSDIIAHFNGNSVAMMRWARHATPGDFGAFAPGVFSHAADGDRVALEIAARAARAIGALARGAVSLGAERVALVGGAGEAMLPYLEPEIAALLSPPLHDASDGAILMAGGVIAAQRRSRAMKVLAGARIFDGERLRDDCALVIEGGSIRALTLFDDRPRGGEQVDLDGGILSPGFIDWQINGGGGVLFNGDPTVEGIAAIAAAHRRAGVTGFLPTVVTDAPRVLTQALAAAREAQKRVPGALGIHVEGPFIDPRRKGVHPPEFIRPMAGKGRRRADRRARGRHGGHACPGLGPARADRAPGEVGDCRQPRPFRRQRRGSGKRLRRRGDRGHPSL